MSLSPDQLEAIREVTALWPDRAVILIGAAALSFHGDFRRYSLDVDLALAVEQDEFPGPLRRLPGWTAIEGRPHTWRSPRGVLVEASVASTFPFARTSSAMLHRGSLFASRAPPRSPF